MVRFSMLSTVLVLSLSLDNLESLEHGPILKTHLRSRLPRCQNCVASMSSVGILSRCPLASIHTLHAQPRRHFNTNKTQTKKEMSNQIHCNIHRIYDSEPPNATCRTIGFPAGTPFPTSHFLQKMHFPAGQFTPSCRHMRLVFRGNIAGTAGNCRMVAGSRMKNTGAQT